IKEVFNEKSVKVSQSKKNLTLSGKVKWPGHDVKDTLIQVYSDPSMTIAVAQTRANDKGDFKLQLNEGNYYVTASIDTDKNEKYSQGDVIGIYGSNDASSISPIKLFLDSDKEIEILITAQFDESGQLKSILSEEEKGDNESDESKPEDNAFLSVTGISGRITWEEQKILKAVIVFSKDQEFKEGTRVNLELEKDGFYICSAPPGGYYVMALVDLGEDGQVDLGDGIGFFGTGYLGMGYWGDPQKVYIIEGRTTPYVNINITASIGKDGELIQTRDGIRSYYSDPDTVIDNAENNTQEWWYWSRGISFTFKKVNEMDTIKWELVDKYEFEPKETKSDSKKENSEGKIYFSYDRNIWSINTDGSERRWINYGDSITGTSDGNFIVFMDSNREIALISADSNALFDLNLRNTGYQPAMSNDGKKIAFTKEIDGRSQIYVRNLITGEENVLPLGNVNVYYPSWSNDDELIAYSAEQTSVENKSSTNRDIYYYDTVTGQSERVTTSPYDEFDPVWSFGDKKILVYCKAEGEIPQLWIVNFDENGRPYERQLTKYGGTKPAWSPKGDKIVYVNNGQLHTIDIDGSNESPVIVNNEPIFGIDPFWIR
ncbi:MAG: TolB family protein, partial [bacterium]